MFCLEAAALQATNAVGFAAFSQVEKMEGCSPVI